MKTRILLALFFAFVFIANLQGQNSQQNIKLSVKKIMQEQEKWVGSLPEDIYWSDDSKSIYFKWNPQNKPVEDIYTFDLNSQEPEKLSLQEQEKLPPGDAQKNNAGTKKVYAKEGRLYLYDIEEKSEKLILNTTENIRSPQFTFNDKAITFVMGMAFYKWDLENNELVQYAEFSRKPKSADQEEYETKKAQWLHNQQMELFTFLQREKNKEEYRDSILNIIRKEKPRTIHIGKSFVTNIKLGPDEKYITYNLYKRGNSKNTKIPHYVSESGYLDIEEARSKVGGNQSKYELHIYDIENDTVYSVKTEDIPGIKERPEYLKEYNEEVDESKPREVMVFGPYWSEDGKNALISVRSGDNKDRWLMLLDLSTGEPELIDRQHDEAWIAGPGISRSWWGEETGWLPDNKHVWYQSEESGYSHLYIYNIEKKKEKALTKGKFEVYDPRISEDEEYWYFNANKVHPGERHFYRMPLMGGKMERLTFMEGRNDVILSPDEKYLAIRHSFSNQPWELYLKENKPDAEPQQITHSLTEEFKAYHWRVPEVITFRADDGAKVPARLFKPENAENKETPAVIFVHGAGYRQNAHKWWSRYSREYMFHNLLVDKGYTVLDIDYRGSAGYGRDWRTGIYRHMGGKDLTDQVDGAEYLIKEHNVNPEKIGIYGGSYGGFITLMALFRHPETFAAGAALRSVTDWAHYNHGYTSNILNEPTKDSLAYRRSSPIYFAEGLDDPLLICHGMIDDNVQFQDVVRLTQRLIELDKEDWELAVYPMERHSFTEPESWTDEYRRILKLFEENLRE